MVDLTTTFDMGRLKLRSFLHFSVTTDMLVAINTCPGNSWANPPETVMSILNIALYGVSLDRDEMESCNEELPRRCSNMKQIREKADGDEELKTAIQN